MPELPEVETVRRGLEDALVGARFEQVEQRRAKLRFAFPERFTTRLEGARVDALERRAKYLVARLDDGVVLAMHLGMSGRFSVYRPETGGTPPPGDNSTGNAAHDHVVFHMSNGARIVYNDARRFGFMTLIEPGGLERHKLFEGLGVEPLGEALTPGYMANAFAGKQTSIKAALLDQRLIAGLGNIYVCEALHRAGISPKRKAANLVTKAGRPAAKVEPLLAAIKTVLEEAIAAGGSTLRDYQHADGSLGYFQHSFAVYGRDGQACPNAGCKGKIERIVQSGRSSFFCSQCQR